MESNLYIALKLIKKYTFQKLIKNFHRNFTKNPTAKLSG